MFYNVCFSLSHLARRSLHSYDTPEEETSSLIYNYQPIYTQNFTKYQQIYFFWSYPNVFCFSFALKQGLCRVSSVVMLICAHKCKVWMLSAYVIMQCGYECAFEWRYRKSQNILCSRSYYPDYPCICSDLYCQCLSFMNKRQICIWSVSWFVILDNKTQSPFNAFACWLLNNSQRL